MEGDFFSTLLEVAGGGRGVWARVRRWSIVLLAVAAITGLLGAYVLLRNAPTTIDVARIEDGYRPVVNQTQWIGDHSYRPNPYRINGHLMTADAVVTRWPSGERVCAPIVSERPGAVDSGPRVYFLATARTYERARAENRFVGSLSRGLDSDSRARFEARGFTVPGDVYLLTAPRWQSIGAAEGTALVTVAGALALLGLVGLALASRPARSDGSRADPSP